MHSRERQPQFHYPSTCFMVLLSPKLLGFEELCNSMFELLCGRSSILCSNLSVLALIQGFQSCNFHKICECIRNKLKHYPLFIKCTSHLILWSMNKSTIVLNIPGLNPNLPEPVNFVPFGTMKYSPFDINLISITCIKFVYLHFWLFLNKA